MNIGERDYYTIGEVAELLKVSSPTVWRWVNSGRLPALRIGAKSIRIKRSDLSRVVEPARNEVNQGTMERYTLRAADQPVDAEDIVRRLRRLQDRILKRRRGKPLAPSAEVIREAREERAARL